MNKDKERNSGGNKEKGKQKEQVIKIKSEREIALGLDQNRDQRKQVREEIRVGRGQKLKLIFYVSTLIKCLNC